MMAQYCRYCSFCVYGDVPYCVDHNKVLTDKMIRRTNKCKDFNLSDLGDVESGRQYKPRKPSIIPGQMKIEVGNG